MGDGKNYGINILFDFSTYKVFIQLDENYQIDFAGSGNFHDLLGFDKKILKGSAFGESLPNITNSIDNIYLRCSLLSDSIIDGKRSKMFFLRFQQIQKQDLFHLENIHKLIIYGIKSTHNIFRKSDFG